MSIDKQNTAFKFSNYQVFAIVILTLTQFTVVLDFMVMSTLGNMIIKLMNLITTQFGFAVSAYLTEKFGDTYLII